MTKYKPNMQKVICVYIYNCIVVCHNNVLNVQGNSEMSNIIILWYRNNEWVILLNVLKMQTLDLETLVLEQFFSYCFIYKSFIFLQFLIGNGKTQKKIKQNMFLAYQFRFYLTYHVWFQVLIFWKINIC